MGSRYKVQWGPTAGHLEAVLPRMEELPMDWLLFKTEKKSAPRPWLSGTLTLFTFDFRFGPQHEEFIQKMNSPLMIAFRTMSMPTFCMSEYTSGRYTLGTGWAISESSMSSSSELTLSRDTKLETTRFMEFMDEDLRGNFITTYNCSEETVAVLYFREIDGRRNATVAGFINKKTGDTCIVDRQVDRRSCDKCVFYDRACECESVEVEDMFESNALIRRELLSRASHWSTINTEYLHNWLVGTWTCNIDDSPYHVVARASDHGEGFTEALRSVIQEEVLRIHPPRQSLILLSYKPPQVSKGFISSMLLNPEPVEDWSSITEVTEEECGESEIGMDGDSPENAKNYQDTNCKTLKASALFINDIVQIPHRDGCKSGSSAVTPILADGRNDGQMIPHSEICKSGSTAVSPILADCRNDGQAVEPHRIPLRAQREGIQLRSPKLKLRRKSGSTEVSVNDHKESISEKPNSCVECKTTFKRRFDLVRHIRIVHEKRKDFKCKECGKAFSQRGHLNEHMSVLHKRSTSHMCVICNRAFATKGKVDRHVQSVHENLRSNHCHHCEKSFKDPSSLKYHLKTAHEKKTDQPTKAGRISRDESS